MSANTLDEILCAADPARSLEAVPEAHRLELRDEATRFPGSMQIRRRRRLVLRLVIAVIAALAVTSGIAWAAGALSPLDLFQSNPEQDGSAPGSLWDQHVLANSVSQVASVDLPKAGPVAFWYGRSAEGGWCAGLRLASGEWLGTGKNKLDGGGTVPGCFPTREAVNGATAKPVYVIDGFDYIEDDVDTRSIGGPFWRIYYGRISAEDATRVTDLSSGLSTKVIRDRLFMLPVPDPDPTRLNDLHLVGYASDGKVVADDCANCQTH
jgi:hypothetical protein